MSVNGNKKKVTAVVPARNCRRELAVCLAALCGGDCPPEIIVVDDASDDGTAQMVREKWPSAVLLQTPVHTGFAHAANLGLRLVRTEYALLIRPQLQPGRSCVRKLLEALEPSIFCAVPRPAFHASTARSEALPSGSGAFRPAARTGGMAEKKRKRKNNGSAVNTNSGSAVLTLAVPDGCAMYRMKTLEEIGWLDERHFDGLEALDLSLRAAVFGAWTVQVPGAHVRPVRTADREVPRNAYGLPMDTFRRQLAAGNWIYVLYKHFAGLPGFLFFRLAAAAVQPAQRRSFGRRGEKDAFRMAQIRGKALCSLERERRGALEQGVSVWAENLPDAAFLGMDKEAERVYPLFLAEQIPFSAAGIREVLGARELFRRSLPEILDQCVF